MTESNPAQEDRSTGGQKPYTAIRKNLTVAWMNRRPILYVSVSAAVVTLAVNLLLPRWYKSTSSLLPETDKSQLSAFTQFADIAQLTGMMPGNGEVSQLYPSILQSESVLLEAIHGSYKTEEFDQEVDLLKYFDIDEGSPAEDLEMAIETLRGLLETSFDSKTGIVTASLEMGEPQLAADVLNAMVHELDRFMREKRITSASEQLRWINLRLEEVEKELRAVEDSLRAFRDRNRRVGDSPSLLLQQQRLIRQVEIHSTTFIELKKQYEVAKIEEIKNISLINVLDSARAPTRKSRPRQLTNTLLVFMLSLAVMSTYCIVRSEYVPRMRRILKAEETPPSR